MSRFEGLVAVASNGGRYDIGLIVGVCITGRKKLSNLCRDGR